MFHQDKVFSAPALPLEEVFDPTGAGDTFAGGFVGYLSKCNEINWDNMKSAIIVGSAMASFTVEKFGIDRLVEVEQDEITLELRHLKSLLRFRYKFHFIQYFFRKMGALLYPYSPAFSKSLHPLISPFLFLRCL